MSRFTDAILRDRPVAWYRLNETSGTVAYDSSGNGHNAVISSSGVTYGAAGVVRGDPTSTRRGGVTVPSTALTFDGSAGCVVYTAGGPQFLASGNGPWSIEGWYNFANVSNTAVLAAFGVANTGQEPNCYLSGGMLFASCWNTDVDVQTVGTGTWYYVATTYDGTTQRAYINGLFVASHAPGTLSVPTSAELAIARNVSPSEYFLHATIQDVAYYVAPLSPARVFAHYAAALALAPALYPVVTPQPGYTFPIVAAIPSGGGSIVSGSATLIANATLAESAQIVAPALGDPLAANAALAESLAAQVIAPAIEQADSVLLVSSARVTAPADADPVPAQAALSETPPAQVIAPAAADPLAATAALAEAPSVLVTSALLASTATLAVTAQIVVNTATPAATQANAAISVPTAQVVEPHATPLVGSAILSASLIAGSGTLVGNAGLSVTPGGQIVTPATPLATQSVLAESAPAIVQTSAGAMPLAAYSILTEAAQLVAAAFAEAVQANAILSAQGTAGVQSIETMTATVIFADGTTRAVTFADGTATAVFAS